jgi:mRNA interferase RelE/StbE
VTYRVDWDEVALDAAAGFLADDAAGLAQVMDASDLLAAQPRPPESVEHGSAARLRLPVGRYRLWYDVDDAKGTVTIVRCGRVA